ncbi:MAG: apolipoprotein N-acyltransferase, partial [Bacteroidales bacterium]|nr:apolipoprotein N-acyltransferase [Bacteroidales bacterium]
PGYRQHVSYASLRAIETRRSIVQSANTGISAFINQRGEREQQTKWWIQTGLRGKINLNEKLTFYVKNGDYPGRIFTWVFLLLSVYSLIIAFPSRKRG